jgi:hypothetical protein
MPANQSLSWFDLDDFSAGLWNPTGAVNQFAAPAKAFVTLDDYQPVKGGGLRPFYSATTVSLSGIGANETIVGLFTRDGVFRPVANGGTGVNSPDTVMVTVNTSDHKVRIYRRDGTVAAPAWSERYASAASSVGDGHGAAQFEYFKDSNGVEWFIISIVHDSTTLAGLYYVRTDYLTTSNTGNDGLASRAQNYCGPLVVSQDRIMVGGGTFSDVLNYSDVGLTTFNGATAGFIAIATARALSGLTAISGIAPADLLIGKLGAPWVTVAGDIADVSTPIREMADQHHSTQVIQTLPRTPGGVCFVEGLGRIFETDGRSFKSLSDMLARRPMTFSPSMTGVGAMAFFNNLLFVPDTNTTGLIYDFDSGAWFRTTATGIVFANADAYTGDVWCANHSSTAATLALINALTNSRVSTGVIQTVPYADKNGRNLDIREVQLFVKTTASTEFKVELIDETGSSVVTRYATVATAKAEIVRLLFPNTKSDYLSVKITPTAAGSAEAPTFERIRIGFGVNNLLVGSA